MLIHVPLTITWLSNSWQLLVSVQLTPSDVSSLSSFKFYDPSFHDSKTILTYSPYPFSYDFSYDTRLWEGRRQQDMYWGPTDNKEDYASRIPDQSRHTWPSPPGSSPRQPPHRPGQPDDPTPV